jgi:hypothetical protein
MCMEGWYLATCKTIVFEGHEYDVDYYNSNSLLKPEISFTPKDKQGCAWLNNKGNYDKIYAYVVSLMENVDGKGRGSESNQTGSVPN